MTFSSRRGRPRKASTAIDYGTPELIMKRMHHTTAEVLDLCLEKNIISGQQHWSGLHFRWLYTLRFGLPTVTAVDPSHFGGRETSFEDESWKAERTAEYLSAIHALKNARLEKTALAYCVFNEMPQFLCKKHRHKKTKLVQHLSLKNTREYDVLIASLELLSEVWKANPTQ